MEALLIINSLLVAVCVYFIKDFHTDFKEVAKTVQGLKDQVKRLAGKVSSLTKKKGKKLEQTDEV